MIERLVQTGRLLVSSQYTRTRERALVIEIDGISNIWLMPAELWFECKKRLVPDAQGDTWLRFSGWISYSESGELRGRFISSFTQGFATRKMEGVNG